MLWLYAFSFVGKSVSSRKRTHKDKTRTTRQKESYPICLHKSKDTILLLEAARDEISRIIGKTLSNLARAAAKIQKAVENLQHLVREHINAKQVTTRQLREASKEINLVRFVFDFRAFEVPGELEEEENSAETKHDKEHVEKSFYSPTFSTTQASMKGMGKAKGDRSKLKTVFKKSKAREKMSNSCIHGQATAVSLVIQKPNGVQGRQKQGKLYQEPVSESARIWSGFYISLQFLILSSDKK